MQDLLDLPVAATLNRPGTTDGNWQWRFTTADLESLSPGRVAKLHHWIGLYERTGDRVFRDYSEPLVHDPVPPPIPAGHLEHELRLLGIQFGWGLQMANMSPIYKYLGAADDQISRLWLAAPLTGFIVQPIIGALSDRTWCRLGRRRPYFLVGAILSSLALLLMPNSGLLADWLIPNLPKFYMAAGLLWILDASINVSMEPFRAFVADKLPEQQRGMGFAMQSFFIGIGAVVAGFLPYILRHAFGVSSESDGANALPTNVKISFYIGPSRSLPLCSGPSFRRRKSRRKTWRNSAARRPRAAASCIS